MFARIRSQQANQDLLRTLSTTMRDSVRRHMHPLIQIDQHNHPEFAAPLAEIYMREFACTLQTLNQVNWIASKYHEHAFDNTDAYIEGERPLQLSPHEMTTEQRHASQILLGVGNNYSEINVALKMLEFDISMRDVMGCDAAVTNALAQKFQSDSCVPEDAFERLQYITRQVWSLVNMLAFSNLFRFADPAQPILIANPDDAIFIPHIPHIPMQQTPVDEGIWCRVCGKRTDEKYHSMTHPNSTFNLCPTCFHGNGMNSDPEPETQELDINNINNSEMNAQKQQHVDEIVEMLADGKITTEQASSLFKELEPEAVMEPVLESESESDNDESNATYWLRTLAAWNAAERIKN